MIWFWAIKFKFKSKTTMAKIKAWITTKITMNLMMKIWTNKATKTLNFRAEKTTAISSSETTLQRKTSARVKRKKMSFPVWRKKTSVKKTTKRKKNLYKKPSNSSLWEVLETSVSKGWKWTSRRKDDSRQTKFRLVQ